jgi:hypothetical protein
LQVLADHRRQIHIPVRAQPRFGSGFPAGGWQLQPG